jgi:hypothetical protein
MRRLLISIAGIATAAGLVTSSPAQAAGPMPIAQNGNSAVRFARTDPALGRTWFDRARAYAWGTPPAKPYSATTGCDRFTSYATFAAKVAAGAIPTRCVMFDLEGGHTWPSPAQEKADPEKYMPMFNRLARAHGLAVVESPGADLQATDTTCPHPPPGSAYYQACRIAYYAAVGGPTVVMVQDQQATLTPSVYGTWFKTSRAQARAASPGTMVFTTCSQNRGTAAQCIKDVRAAGTVDGLDDMQSSSSSWEATVLKALG